MEELQLIVKALSTMGPEAKGMFIWWIVSKMFSDVTFVIVIGGLFYGSYKLCKKWLDKFLEEEYK